MDGAAAAYDHLQRLLMKTMLLIKRICVSLGILIGGLASPALSAREAGAYSAGSAWIFSTQVILQSGPGMMPSRCSVTSVGTNQFAFLVPEGYAVDISNPQMVTVSSTNGDMAYTVRIRGPKPEDGGPLDVSAYRDQSLQEHPKAKIVAEIGANAGDGFGPAFDLRWMVGGKVDRFTRVGYVPTRLGVMEFSISCSPKAAGSAKSAMSYMMATFRLSEANGKIALPSISNRI